MNGKLKWLTVLVAVLVVANITLAAFVWLRSDAHVKPGRPQDARDYLVRSLLLNDTQVKAFDSLRKGHFEKVQGYRNGMRDLKDQLFDQLRWPRHSGADSLAQQIGNLQAKVDLETFEHFAALRSLLTKEQAKKFDAAIRDVLRSMAPNPEGGPPRRPPDGAPPGGGPEDGPPR